MKKHAYKAFYLAGAVFVAGLVHVVGEYLGEKWQISAATLIILCFVAAISQVLAGRIREASQNTRILKLRLGQVQRRVESGVGARDSVHPVDDMHKMRTAVEKLTKSQSDLDARIAHLTQVATQIAVEMDFLDELLRRQTGDPVHHDNGRPA